MSASKQPNAFSTIFEAATLLSKATGEIVTEPDVYRLILEKKFPLSLYFVDRRYLPQCFIFRARDHHAWLKIKNKAPFVFDWCLAEIERISGKKYLNRIICNEDVLLGELSDAAFCSGHMWQESLAPFEDFANNDNLLHLAGTTEHDLFNVLLLDQWAFGLSNYVEIEGVVDLFMPSRCVRRGIEILAFFGQRRDETDNHKLPVFTGRGGIILVVNHRLCVLTSNEEDDDGKEGLQSFFPNDCVPVIRNTFLREHIARLPCVPEPEESPTQRRERIIEVVNNEFSSGKNKTDAFRTLAEVEKCGVENIRRIYYRKDLGR